MEPGEVLDFRTSEEWREWLSHHHDKAPEAWLLYYKKHSGKVSIRYEEALDETLCFGWIDGKLKSVDAEKYIIRYTPRKTRSVWSSNNKQRAERLIRAGRMTEAGLVKIEQAKRNGAWENAYDSRERVEAPGDLRRALTSTSRALSNFQNFAPGYRHSYIRWINQARTDETRKRRIAEVVKRSLANKKPGEG